MAYFFKVISALFLCSLFFSKMGMPATCILFKFNFIEVFIVACAGAIGGTIFYVYLFESLIKWWDKYKENKPYFTKRKTFTKSNRRIIKVKNKFGLTGIAILAPILLSIPLGAFLGERFYKNKAKVITYMSVSTIVWCVILYVIYYQFYDYLKGWVF
ncbi:MAG: hypothetical protein LCH32_13210 [Bacteroidetes bacterium]|nr:hypothetical protein [Bacteroidota bacterium]